MFGIRALASIVKIVDVYMNAGCLRGGLIVEPRHQY